MVKWSYGDKNLHKTTSRHMECHVTSPQWLVRNDYVVAKWFYGDRNLHKFDRRSTELSCHP